MTRASYQDDLYSWATEQAALLRAGQLSEVDTQNLAEELEAMGKRERREMINRLAVLLAHLLKWQYQPGRRGASWEATIIVQRDDLVEHLADNPGLESQLPEVLTSAYRKAAIMAMGETALPRSTFPLTCPWTLADIMDEDFWPGG